MMGKCVTIVRIIESLKGDMKWEDIIAASLPKVKYLLPQSFSQAIEIASQVQDLKV